MSLVFKTRSFSTDMLKSNHKALADIVDLKLAEDEYITSDALAEEFRLPAKTTLQVLDQRGVRPIAKIVSRSNISKEHPDGKPQSGRPRLAFSPAQAREALFEYIENRYN